MEDHQDGFKRPFPALTPAQRLHFEVFGYVVIENTLTEEQTLEIREALYRLKRDFLATDDPINAIVRGSKIGNLKSHVIHFTHVLETDPAILDYVSHPRLVGMIEELVGHTVRLEESEAQINSRDPDQDLEIPPRYGFHAGVRPDIGTYVENGLTHSSFVKTLTNLTDLGPEDGGTVVIAGSHKIKCPREEIIECAYEDPSLIHQVEAPAGSTLLFTEALIHATGQRRSDGERAIMVAGYTPTQFQAWTYNEPSEEFVNTIPGQLRPLISGSGGWNGRKERFRSLRDSVEAWP